MIIQTKLVLFWNSNWNKEIEQSVDLCYSDDKIIIKINIFSFLCQTLVLISSESFFTSRFCFYSELLSPSKKLRQWLVSCAFLWSCLGSFWAASARSRAKGYKNKTYDCKKDHKIFHFYGFDYPAFEFDIAAIIVFWTTPKYFNKNLLTRFELNSQIFNVD